VDRALKRRLALAVAIAALITGGAVAAIAATAPSGHDRARVAKGTPRDLPAASSYLGLPPSQLQAEVRSGKTLAQIAAATPGKSEAGLIAAIVAAKQAKLAVLAAKLTKRVKAEVNRVPGQGAAAAVIRTYLGLPRTQLRSELLSGRTLAQIADATSGKSAAGLVAAIVAARHKRLAAMLAAGKLTQAQIDSRSATLTRRVTRLVNTPRHRHAAR
jgi:hypothetical protein